MIVDWQDSATQRAKCIIDADGIEWSGPITMINTETGQVRAFKTAEDDSFPVYEDGLPAMEEFTIPTPVRIIWKD